MKVNDNNEGMQVKYSNPVIICVENVALIGEQQLKILLDHQGLSEKFHVSEEGLVYANSKYGFVLVKDIEDEFKVNSYGE